MKKTFICINCQKESVLYYSSKGIYCSNKCQGEYKRKAWMEANREAFENGTLPSRAAAKKYVKERDGNKCSVCGQEPIHNNKPLVMIIDHIDGDSSNNKPNNYRLVCPNCDSQLPTYKGANRGSGRATKGMKWYSSI